MSLVSEILTVERAGRLTSYFTTNVPAARFQSQLAAKGILDSVSEIFAYFGDRAEGGRGYEVVWKANVDWNDLMLLLCKF